MRFGFAAVLAFAVISLERRARTPIIALGLFRGGAASTASECQLREFIVGQLQRLYRRAPLARSDTAAAARLAPGR